jgi:RimJ/RimL family protein N-acetyltransferase
MTNNISLREVQSSDLPVFFEQQLDPDATRMAAFPSRAHDAFMAHWAKIMADGTTILRTILFQGNVAGSILAWGQPEERKIGYWLGKEFWGKGIASAALAQFVAQVQERPLVAYVAKRNVASIRVLQKCGFTIAGEGTFGGSDGEEVEELILTLASDGPR